MDGAGSSCTSAGAAAGDSQRRLQGETGVGGTVASMIGRHARHRRREALHCCPACAASLGRRRHRRPGQAPWLWVSLLALVAALVPLAAFEGDGESSVAQAAAAVVQVEPAPPTPAPEPGTPEKTPERSPSKPPPKPARPAVEWRDSHRPRHAERRLARERRPPAHAGPRLLHVRPRHPAPARRRGAAVGDRGPGAPAPRPRRLVGEGAPRRAAPGHRRPLPPARRRVRAARSSATPRTRTGSTSTSACRAPTAARTAPAPPPTTAPSPSSWWTGRSPRARASC